MTEITGKLYVFFSTSSVISIIYKPVNQYVDQTMCLLIGLCVIFYFLSAWMIHCIKLHMRMNFNKIICKIPEERSSNVERAKRKASLLMMSVIFK
jgi:biotin transporter BioY